MTCPNINTDEWKALEAKYKEDKAYLLYYRNNGVIPSLKEADKILKQTPDILNKFIFEGVELNAAQRNELFSSLKYYFISTLVNDLDNSQDYANLLDDSMDAAEIFQPVYEKALSKVINNLPEQHDEISIALAQDYANNNLAEDLGVDPSEGSHRNAVYEQFKTYMSTVLNFKENQEDEDKDTQNNNNKEQIKDSWIKESIEQNRKDSFSRGIKLLLSGVPRLLNAEDLKDFSSYDINESEDALGLIRAMDQSEINNTLTNLFANVTPTVENFIEVIENNKDQFPELQWLYNKVFNAIDVISDDEGNTIAELKDNSITSLPKINLMIKFIQSFSNNKYNLITYVVQPGENGYVIKPQDADSNSIQRKMMDEWRSGLLNKLLDKNFVSELKELIKDKEAEEILELLEFPIANYDLLDPDSPASNNTILIKGANNTFIDVVSDFIDNLEKNLKRKDFDFEELFNPKVNKDLYVLSVGLIEHNSPYRQDYDGQLFNSNGDRISKNNLNSYQTLLLNRVKNTIKKVRKNNSKLKDQNKLKKLILEQLENETPEILNLWSSDSMILERLIDGENIEFSLLDGMKSTTKNENTTTGSMVETDLWSTFINSNLHNVLTPVKHSDRSSFLGIKMPYGSTDILGNGGEFYSAPDWENKFKTYIYQYLRTELKRIKSVRTTKTGIPLMDKQGVNFVLFDGLFGKTENDNKILDKLLKENLNTYNLSSDVNVQKLVNKWVNNYLDTSVVKAQMAEINSTGKGDGIDKAVAEEYFKRIPAIKNNYDELIKIAAAKHFISAVEQSKLFFGDPALYSAKAKDGILIYDMIKRLNMQSSTKQVSVVDNTTNSFLNSILKSNDFKITLDGKTFEYKKDFNGDINELIINDPETISSIGNELKTLFGENSPEYQAYTKGFEESDGYSIGNIFFAIETLFRTEGINPGRLELAKKEIKAISATEEEFYNLYTVPEGMSAEYYINNSLRPFTQQKFQYVGPNYQKSREDYIAEGTDGNWQDRIGVVAGRKTSYGFLMPSMVRGTVLEQLNNFMLENGIDVIHFSSAAKFGAATSRDFYNTIKTEDGQYTVGFNTLAIEDNERGVLDFRYMGKQQEIAYETKDKIVDATQARKNENAGIMLDGELPIDFNGIVEQWDSLSYEEQRQQSDLFNLLEEKDQAISDYVNKLTNTLFDEYKIDNANNITDPIGFVNLIKDAAVERGTPDNILDAIVNWLDSDENLKPIESLPNYNKVQYILTSIITNNILILKRNGTMLPQAPSTGWESASRQVLDGKFTAGSYLKYYQPILDENGNVLELIPAECAMPLNPKDIDKLFQQYPQAGRNINKLLDILNAELDQKFESGNLDDVPMIKALRIPHQQLSSTDVLRVRRWLNPIYNQTILVPSEFIVKNGSDYDIDKLTIYMPNLNDSNKPYQYEYNKENLFDNWFYNTIGKEVLDNDQDYSALVEDLVDIKEQELANKLNVKEEFKQFYNFVENITGSKTNNIKDAFDALNKARKEKRDRAIEISKYLDKVYRKTRSEAKEAKTYIENFEELDKTKKQLFEDVRYIQTVIDNILLYDKQSKQRKTDINAQKKDILELLYINRETIKDSYRDQFNQVDISDLNPKQAHENRLLDIELKLLLHPARAKRFLTPVIEGSFKQIAKNKQKANLKIANKPGINMFQLDALVDAVLNFTGGKKGVGIIATWITFQNIAERYNIRLKSSAKLNIPGINNTQVGNYIQLANTTTTDLKEEVENIYSALMTSQVDIVKDDYAAFVNICLSTLNTVCYLVSRGTPTQSIIDIIDSPIVVQYLKIKNARRALSTNAYPGLSSNKLILDFLRTKYSKDEMSNLLTYIAASDQAKAITKVKDLISADTRYLKSPSEVDDVTINLYAEVMSDEGIVPQEDVEKLLNETLLAPFVNSRQSISDVFGKLYITRQNKIVKEKLNQIKLNLFSHIFTNEEKKKAIQKFDESLITYLIQNESGKFKDRFNKLFTGNNSLPRKIQDIKYDEKYINNPIIQNLVPILNKKIGNNVERDIAIDNLKIFLTQLTVGESNSLIEAYQELKSLNPSLYNDLVIFNIFQSGISNGTYQYSKVISYEAQKNILEALVNLDPKSITDEKLADFTVKFMLSNSFNEKVYKNKIGGYFSKLREEELENEALEVLADMGGVENESPFDPDDFAPAPDNEDTSYNPDEDLYNPNEEEINPFKIFRTFRYTNGKIKLVNTVTDEIINPIGGYDGMDYTQDISKFKDLVYEIKNAIKQSVNKPTKPARSTQSTTPTQPQASVSTTRKTYSGKITTLKDNQIFVFGSNIGSSKGGAPTHGAGAAKLAKERFGAIQGKPRGIQGKSYGIVTKKYYDVKKSSTPQEIIEEIKGLYEYAKQNPEKEFLVSDYSESNLNGYTGKEMADMFSSAGPIPFNIVFNENFDKLLPNTQPQADVSDNTFTPIEGLNERLDAYGNAKVILSNDFREGPRPKGRLNAFKTSIDQVADNIMILADLNLNEFDFLTEEDKKRLDALRPLAKELSKINRDDIIIANRRTVAVEKRFAQLSNELANEFVDIIGKHVEQQLGKSISSSNPRLQTTPQADTFYNLKGFSDELKFTILDKMIAKYGAESEKDAIDQLNTMLLIDKEKAIKFMINC